MLSSTSMCVQRMKPQHRALFHIKMVPYDLSFGKKTKGLICQGNVWLYHERTTFVSEDHRIITEISNVYGSFNQRHDEENP